MSAAAASTALAGLTVIDLTRARAGPTCVRQFADWGASVIKVEMRESDPANSSRPRRPPRSRFPKSSPQEALARDRPQEPRGIRIFRRLVELADIVVENYRPDVKFRLGIDYESLKSVNPRLIYASISGFGQEGPYRDRPGVDQIAQGHDRPDVDHRRARRRAGAGRHRAHRPVGGAVRGAGRDDRAGERHRSGEGQWVQTSLLQARALHARFPGRALSDEGDVPKQVGNNHPTGVPTGAFRTRTAISTSRRRRRCGAASAHAIGRPDLIEHPDFATPPCAGEPRAAERAPHRGDHGEGRRAAVLIEKFNAAGIPVRPDLRYRPGVRDPQVQHLGIAQQVLSTALGEITLIGQPVTLSRTPSRLATFAPEYGEHDDAILAKPVYRPPTSPPSAIKARSRGRLSLRGAERRSNLVPAGRHCLHEIASLRSQ